METFNENPLRREAGSADSLNNGRKLVVLADYTGDMRLYLILRERYQVLCSRSVREAKTLIGDRAVDLIVCCSSFSDSTMFDSLAATQGISLETGAPFVCVRLDNQLSSYMNKSVEQAANRLGARRMIEANQLTDEELAEAIDQCFPFPEYRLAA